MLKNKDSPRGLKREHRKLLLSDPYTRQIIVKPNFHSRRIFSENLIAIEMRKLNEIHSTNQSTREYAPLTNPKLVYTNFTMNTLSRMFGTREK